MGLSTDRQHSWTYRHEIQQLMSPLSAMVGFGGQLHLHHIRRGCLSILKEFVDRDTTKTTMGHDMTLRAFSHYKSKIS